MIKKEIFVNTINNIQSQLSEDKKTSELLQEAFGIQEFPYKDNFLLTSLIEILRFYFPIKENHCEISHYMFCLDFGKCGNEYESVEDLYNRLISES